MARPVVPTLPPGHDAAAGHLGPNGRFAASVNESMAFLGNGRAKFYELINSGEIESYLDGGSHKVPWRALYDRVNRLLAVEAARRGRAA